jgi:hypothetical protein
MVLVVDAAPVVQVALGARVMRVAVAAAAGAIFNN